MTRWGKDHGKRDEGTPPDEPERERERPTREYAPDPVGLAKSRAALSRNDVLGAMTGNMEALEAIATEALGVLHETIQYGDSREQTNAASVAVNAWIRAHGIKRERADDDAAEKELKMRELLKTPEVRAWILEQAREAEKT